MQSDSSLNKLIAKKQLVINGGNQLVKQGLITRTWGNVSNRLDSQSFVITPSGIPYSKLTNDNIVQVKLKDLSYDGNIKPSSETSLHASIYRAKKNVNAIIHTHQLSATALSIFPDDISLSHYNTAISACANGILPVTGYNAITKQELENVIIEKIKVFENAGVILLAHHGAVIFAESMDECFELSTELENTCTDLIKKLSGGRLPLEKPKSRNKNIKMQENGKTESELIKNILNANQDYKYCAVCTKPHIKGLAKSVSSLFILPAFVEDFAQIAGASCSLLKKDYKLGENNMAIVPDVGCIALANTESDAEAICEITEKNALICLLSEHIFGSRPMPIENAMSNRKSYLTWYSKLGK